MLNEEQGELAFKLPPTKKHGDRDAFTRIISDGEFLDENRSRICEAFTFFQDELKKRVQSGIRPDGLLTMLTTSFKVVFINLETSESPYRIFETRRQILKAIVILNKCGILAYPFAIRRSK